MRGLKWLTAVLPLWLLVKCAFETTESYAPFASVPEQVVLAFYDATPGDTLDAGVWVSSAECHVNGRRVVPAPAYRDYFRRAFAIDRDTVMLPRSIPLARPSNGVFPILVQFELAPEFWRFADDMTQLSDAEEIEYMEVEFGVSGNYVCKLLHTDYPPGDNYDPGVVWRDASRTPWSVVLYSSPSYLAMSSYYFATIVEAMCRDGVHLMDVANGAQIRTRVYQR